MNSLKLTRFFRNVHVLGWVFVGFLASQTGLAQTGHGVLREVFLNIGGGAISDLVNHPSYPNSPSLETIEAEFEAPRDFADSYGQRMQALLIPPVDGNYVFWISSDDNGALYLSSTDEPEQKQQIATVNGWTPSRDWTREANQRSASILLQGGRSYYIEALQKEGGGGDNLAVRWQLPSGTIEEPIPNSRLLVYGLGPPSIARQPEAVTVVEGGTATFEVRLARVLGASFQWRRDGIDIPAATNAVLSLGPVTLAENSDRLACFIANAYGSVLSDEATLSVLRDTTRPTLSTVGSLGDPRVLFVVFSEPVAVESATDPDNYRISGGVNVTRAAFGVDARTIILTTSPMSSGVTYTLTVNGVRDRAATPNTIASNSQRTVSLNVTPLDVGLLTLPREPLGPANRRHGVVVSEVMYHPAERPDGRNLEFIEIYNAQPWFEELGGWRISGAVDYEFPTGTVLNSRSYLVIAARPDDLKAVSGLSTVLGPFAEDAKLPNNSATLRLRNAADAVVFEMTYRDEAPYPVAADGAGHSLVLARPSYGEGDARAWEAGERTGGSPGLPETGTSHAWRTILINEFLAHTDLPDVDFVELYNYGTATVDLGGCTLADDTSTNVFTIAANTTIEPGGFRHWTEQGLGFALSAAGERLLLRSPDGTRVIDAVRFGGQENGVATGRYPDGAGHFSRLDQPTPAAANVPCREKQVMINEIMHEPVTGDADEEFIELHNRTGQAVDVGGWRLRDAVSFDMPAGTTIAAGGFLVVARNRERILANYPDLDPALVLGNWSGRLGNRRERIEWSKPDQIAGTNTLGQLETNTIHIVVDEIIYGSGGRWGTWSAGGGSSMELRDARADGRLAPNWADSDETGKSDWVTVEATGVMDNGWTDAYQLHVTLGGEGEALVDGVEVIPAGGANVIANGHFESGVSGWVFQGNHNRSGWESAAGFQSSCALHVRATGRGDTGSNRIRTQLPTTLSPGTTVTLRARVRWLKGNPNILLRLRGNWMEAPGYTLTARNLGTPGAANSRATANAGPAITGVRHTPVLPTAGQSVRVLAHVHDPDGLAFLVLNYRIDPSSDLVTVAMSNQGAGLFSAVIPAQSSGATVAFHIRAGDNHETSAQTLFPDDAPERECLVRWGDTAVAPALGTYRFWLTQRTIDRWAAEEKMSNRPKDITFIYGTSRIVYNAGGFFHGSPYHSPSYNSPVGNACDYDLHFPGDDRLLGETDINLFRPGNGGGDSTGQREIHGYWFGSQFGIPFLYHRPVVVYVNGQRRETLFHDAQQPNGDFVKQWYPDDAQGDLHKIKLGFEFGDQAYGNGEAGYAVVGANLARYLTTGGEKKLARYRQTWALRSNTPLQENQYSNLYALVDAANTTAAIGSEAYTAVLTRATDVEEWFKVHVTQHLYNNPDSFSYGGGQNAFAYKPERGPWQLLLWDIDFAFGGSPTDSNLTGIGGADHGPRNNHPPFDRIYWQALIEAANGMLTPQRSNSILDSRFNGMVSGGATVGSPQSIKDFIASRRAYILTQIAANQALFAVTSPGGLEIVTSRNLVELKGTAPLEVRTLLVNGVPYAVTWTARDTWSILVPLAAGSNALRLTALDPQGQAVAGVDATVQATFTGQDERPEDRIVINEIMYNPPVGNAGYVELHNTSEANAFDLSGWRLNGVDFVFPGGTVIEPGAYLVLAEESATFAAAYGSEIPLSGQYSGKLDNGGETLTLLRPGATQEEEWIVDQVTYDDDPPWFEAADGRGPSLQLVDPSRDNQRAANWEAVNPSFTNAPQHLIAITDEWRYEQTRAQTTPAWTQPDYSDASWASGPALLYVEGSALPAPKNTPLTLGRTTYYFRRHFQFRGSPAGASLKLSTVIDDGAVFYLNGQVILRLGMPEGAIGYGTLAGRVVGNAGYEGPFILPANALVSGDNVLAVEVHQTSSGSSDVVFGLTLATTYDVLSLYTPGAANGTRDTLPVFPSLWLNEVLPDNSFPGAKRLSDGAGDADPWVELYNNSPDAISLAGYYLSNSSSNLTQWAFPSGSIVEPGQFFLVWLDGEPSEGSTMEPHTSFRAEPAAGLILLSRGEEHRDIVDHLAYRLPGSGRSYGSYPDAAVNGRRLFSVTTPGAPNNPAFPDVNVRINEWMADNSSTLADPADGRFEDWFELYNAGDTQADLGGFYLSDSLQDPTSWRVPEGTILPPGGYLLVWGDGDEDQNQPGSETLHAGFSLSRDGEAIALFAPDATLIDAVMFGAQNTDASEGRFPDGDAAIFPLSWASPRAANVIVSDNHPPTLAQVADQAVEKGELVRFSLVADDVDVPAQALTFSLGPGAPESAYILANRDVFLWQTTATDEPGVYPVEIIVTDDGIPNLSTSRTVTITVRAANAPPVLTSLNSRTVDEGSLLTVTNSASDPDEAAQTLEFSLDAEAPPGTAIDPVTGVLTWTPTEAQGPGNYTFNVHVTDDGEPALSDATPLTVFVREANAYPHLTFPAFQTVHAGQTLMFTAEALDEDLPAQILTFELGADAPPGAAFEPALGLFSWTPEDSQTGTNVMTLRVRDDGSPPGESYGKLTVVVESSLVAVIGQMGEQVTIWFPTVPGQTYRVEYRDRWNETEWRTLGNPRVADGRTGMALDVIAAGKQRFYRVVQLD